MAKPDCKWCRGTGMIEGAVWERWECGECLEVAGDRTKLPFPKGARVRLPSGITGVVWGWAHEYPNTIFMTEEPCIMLVDAKEPSGEPAPGKAGPGTWSCGVVAISKLVLV